MKKSKKILSGVMALCLMGSMSVIPESIAPVVSVAESAESEKSGTCGENLTWILDDEGTLTISGTGDMENYGYSYIDNLYVPYSPSWISEEESIKKVIIEDGVTSIGRETFFINSKLSPYENLKEVIISESVKTIGTYAFYNCENLTKIEIPENVTYIGADAFARTKWLEERQAENEFVVVNGILVDASQCSGDITIPYNVTKIPMCVLDFCKATSIVFPENILEIDGNALCKNLKSITVLNADCKIDNLFYNKYVGDFEPYFDGGIVYGYENSTAQAYAEKYKEYGYTFESLGEAPTFPLGNINNDEYIDAVDATAVLMEYAELSTGGGTTLNYAERKAGDVNGDGEINAVDATLILNYYSEVSTGNKITFPDFISANT